MASLEPLTKRQICRLWGISNGFIEEKVNSVLSRIEYDMNELDILQQLNKHGMDVENVVIDIRESNKSNHNNSNPLQTDNNESISDEEMVNDENDENINNKVKVQKLLTSLHKYPLLGPFKCSSANRTYQNQWNCDNRKCAKNRVQRTYKMKYWECSENGDEFTFCNECVENNKISEILTTLHQYPMIGAFECDINYKWNCDNKQCSKNRNFQETAYWKSKEKGDEFTLCPKCVEIHQKKGGSEAMGINRNIGNKNNSDLNNIQQRRRKRKREDIDDNNDDREYIEGEPVNKRRKITKMMRSLSLNDSISNKENEEEIDDDDDKESVMAIIVLILEEDKELNRDKLFSKINKKIADNDRINGKNWRRAFQSKLGKFDEFIKKNDRFKILNGNKRNFIVQLNDEQQSGNDCNSDHDEQEMDEIDEMDQDAPNLDNIPPQIDMNDYEIDDISEQQESEANIRRNEVEEKQISISDNDDDESDLHILPNYNNPIRSIRSKQRILSLTDSESDDDDDNEDNDDEEEEDIDDNDKDSEYSMSNSMASSLSASPSNNVFALYRYRNGRLSRKFQRKASKKNSESPGPTTNTSSSMKEEADSDDENENDEEKNETESVTKNKNKNKKKHIDKNKKKEPKKWKEKTFNPLKIKYSIKARKFIEGEDREWMKQFNPMRFDQLKPITEISQIRDLRNSSPQNVWVGGKIFTVNYDKKYICNDETVLKSLYDASFLELSVKPKKPKPRKKDKNKPQKTERRDYTVQAVVKKTKKLHLNSEKEIKRYSSEIDITLNRLQKNGNCFIVDIPATIGLISRSDELTKDIIETMNIKKEYYGRGHQNTSISLLDFACRYNDNDDDDNSFNIDKQCRICYKSSMINSESIPCGHKFCKKCIWNHFIEEDENQCPVCHQEWEIDEITGFVGYHYQNNDDDDDDDDDDDGEEIKENEDIPMQQEGYKLNVVAFPYQVQSIEWMINEENNKEGIYRNIFRRGRFKNGEIFYYSAALNRLVLSDKLPVINGGFLCEEMGLGKTIECLALIAINKRKDEYSTSKRNIVAFKESAKRKKRIEIKQKTNNHNNNYWRSNYNDEDDEDGLFQIKPKKKKYKKKEYQFIEKIEEYTYYKGGGTLIIGPVTLIGQWEHEIDMKSNANLTYRRYYGSRSRNIKNYFDFDIIFTTYGVLAKEDGHDRRNHVLHRIEWHRIVCDESHYLKNGGCRTSINVNELKAKNKWLLSGTPFEMPYDLYNQLKFIGINTEYLNAMKLKEIRYNTSIIKIIKYMIMRHKKGQKFNNKSIVKMPDKEENVIYVSFTSKQKKYYDKLYKTSKEIYDSYKATGNASRGTLPILSSLHGARMACSGYIANIHSIEEELVSAQTSLQRIKLMVSRHKNKSSKELYELSRVEAYNKDSQCVICLECPPDSPLQTPCNHIFCGECITKQIESNGNCPICRKQINNINQLKLPMNSNNNKDDNHNNNDEELEEDDDCLLDKRQIIRFDAKIKILINRLKKLDTDKPNDKALIFTSFSKSLDWICSELDRHGIIYKTLSGSMAMNKRAKNLKEFATNLNVKVFILTVRTGAVGLTLNAANHVFMMEPTFNPALHRQAINRVYRLGQNKKVFINTFIMKNSIEERIWNINKEKQKGDINNKNNKNMYGNIKEDKAGIMKSNEIEKLFNDSNL